MIKKILSFAILLIVTTSPIFSQQTGSFDATIQFMGENRTLSLYVPTDYDAEKSYKVIIGLHGMGDNSQNFRNVLHTQADWQGLFEETIFIYPDGGNDQGSDFYTPAGDEEIIQASIDFLNENYSIDATEIIMTGFSLGGRSALKYGLDFPDKFKGMFLNAAAIQSILDAKNDPTYSLRYKFENSSKLPIVLSVGSEDIAFAAFNQVIYDAMKEQNGIVLINVIDGMGHTICSNSFTQQYVGIINNPLFEELAIEMNTEYNHKNVNEMLYGHTLKLRTFSKTDITSIKFQLSENGISTEYTWTGEMSAFEMTEITLPEFELEEGTNSLDISILEVNGETEGFISIVENILVRIEYFPTGYVPPFVETFENNSQTLALWETEFSGNVFRWGLDNSAAKEGTNSMTNFNQPFYYINEGIEEILFTPPIDLTKLEEPELSFDLAFNYLQFGPPDYQQELTFSDELIVYLSTNFGKTYREVYNKIASQLATSTEPIYNPNSLEAAIFVPTDDEWRKETIDLSKYKDNDNVIFKFVSRSGLGGTTYLDNVRVGEPVTSVEEELATNTALYPIPAISKTTLTFEYTANGFATLELFDILGNKVLTMNNVAVQNGNNSIEINTTSLNSGVYVIKLSDSNLILTQKLIVE
jgi:predicted esterase